eukprot:TRINITY_DN80709_c0_g1_i1.p1 TRINITY_DN80709_c0_g1~~TRINITY_DN80709_c0_g1_i1.p1  ORF type:complete len:190 (-),score=56.26 TRINITY_DN80709_c0_g1_i1:108-677(-)
MLVTSSIESCLESRGYLHDHRSYVLRLLCAASRLKLWLERRLSAYSAFLLHPELWSEPPAASAKAVTAAVPPVAEQAARHAGAASAPPEPLKRPKDAAAAPEAPEGLTKGAPGRPAAEVVAKGSTGAELGGQKRRRATGAAAEESPSKEAAAGGEARRFEEQAHLDSLQAALMQLQRKQSFSEGETFKF